MARDDQRVRVGAAGLADGTWRIFEVFGQCTLGLGFAQRDGADFIPHPALENCAGRAQEQAKNKGRVGQLGLQLTHGFGSERGGRSLFVARLKKLDAGHFIVIALHAERKAGGCNDRLVVCCAHGGPWQGGRVDYHAVELTLT